MQSKIIGLLILSLISCSFASSAIVATQITSLTGCSGTTCSLSVLAGLNGLTTLATAILNPGGFGLNFSASAFSGSSVTTFTIDPAGLGAGAGLTAGLYIDPSITATFVLSSANTIAIGAAQGTNNAITVGTASALQVGSNVQASGDVVVDGALTLTAAAASTTTMTISGSLQTSASASSSSSANSAVTVQGSTTLSVSGTVDLLAAVNVQTNALFSFAAAAQFGAAVLVAGSLNASTTTATYTQQQATLTLNQGFVTANTVTMAGSSTLAGNGYITGTCSITANAQVSVGNSPGTVYVNGDYNMASTSKFNLEIASQTSFDRLFITGTANLNGALSISLLDNYIPNSGNTFSFLTHRARNGKFSTVTGNTISTLTKYNANYDSSTSTSVTYTSSAVASAISLTVMLVALVATLL